MRHRVPSRTATCGSLHPLDPAIDLAFCLVLGDAVALLDAANELVLLAVDDRNVVLGQLAPLLLDLAGELLPVAFNAIPIHLSCPLLSMSDCSLCEMPAQRGSTGVVAG